MFESRNGMKIVPNLPVDFTGVDGGRECFLPQKSLCSGTNLTRVSAVAPCLMVIATASGQLMHFRHFLPMSRVATTRSLEEAA